jgi:hypothetical protein
MAQTISGFYGAVTAPGEAGRFHRLAPPRVERAGMFPATSAATRTITLGAGTCLVCGIRFNESATAAIALPANSSGAIRYDVIGYRFTWTSTGGTVALFSRQGTSTALPVLDRRPGVVYEFPLVGVIVRSGITTIATSDIFDMRARGGFGGGPWTVDNTTFMNGLDIPQGAYLKIGASTYQAWTVDGLGNTSFLLVSSSSGPWQTFTPTLRAGGNAVNMGVTTGRIIAGQYQVLDGTCRVKIQLVPGSSGYNFGSGPFSIDLPVLAAASPLDQWGEGRLYTTVGDGAYQWIIKGLIRRDIGQRVNLYAVTAGNDDRLLPAGAAIGGGPGLGIPYIANVYSEPRAITFSAEYLI